MSEPPLTTNIAEKAQASHWSLMIVLYASVAFLYWVSLYLYVPTLPTYIQSKSESLSLVGLVLSMYGLWQAIIRLPLGIAADWLGSRKPFILLGLALAGLGAWIMGNASGAGQLLAGRAITGLAAGAWVPLIVVFSGLFPAHQAVRASTLLTLVASIARVLATGVTGSLNELGGYSLAFFLTAGVASLAVLIVLPIPEQRRQRRQPSLAQIGKLITRKDVLLPSLLSAVSQYANWAATFGFIPILARQLGASDIVQSTLVSMSLAIVIVGNSLATAIVQRTGPQRLVHASFLLLSIGLAGVGLARSLTSLFLSQSCIGMSLGIVYPVLMGMSIERVPDGERNTAMGLHQALYAVGMFSGPWISGWLADLLDIRPMFGITACFCLAAGLLVNQRLTVKD